MQFHWRSVRNVNASSNGNNIIIRLASASSINQKLRKFYRKVWYFRDLSVTDSTSYFPLFSEGVSTAEVLLDVKSYPDEVLLWHRHVVTCSCQPAYIYFNSVKLMRAFTCTRCSSTAVQASVRPSVRLSVRPAGRPSVRSSFVYPSVGPSVHPSVRPSFRLSVLPFGRPTSVWPSVRPSVRPFVLQSAQPSFRPSFLPPIRPLVRPSDRPSVKLARFINAMAATRHQLNAFPRHRIWRSVVSRLLLYVCELPARCWGEERVNVNQTSRVH